MLSLSQDCVLLKGVSTSERQASAPTKIQAAFFGYQECGKAVGFLGHSTHSHAPLISPERESYSASLNQQVSLGTMFVHGTVTLPSKGPLLAGFPRIARSLSGTEIPFGCVFVEGTPCLWS